jgi:hypothetical protein
VSVSTIGRAQIFNGGPNEVRRTSRDGTQDDDEIPPATSPRRPGASSRNRSAPITIDLRPDPPSETSDEAAHTARRGAFEHVGSESGRRGRRAPEANPEPQWTYRANPDTPYRRRTSDETYQAVEEADAPEPRRGGIYDRRI